MRLIKVAARIGYIREGALFFTEEHKAVLKAIDPDV